MKREWARAERVEKAGWGWGGDELISNERVSLKMGRGRGRAESGEGRRERGGGIETEE